ncbi:uncharacterized protein LOC131598299 [Vicia villosa]|uniref:uncharacterized protein LOC131598299 n=1 Tax=Vicia villosa TaxID=3911 RepID=UPI00273B2752|nr:uncharacterized protein LOC131598299 [Vicia villosa]
MGVWEGGSWRWGNFGIGDSVSLMLLPRLEALKELLFFVVPDRVLADEVRWSPSGDGFFSVSSCYAYLSENLLSSTFVSDREKALGLVWKALIPFRFKAFAWRILIDSLPTKINLFVRGVISSSPDLLCVFCKDREESLVHLLFSCDIAKLVWSSILGWLKVDLILPSLVWENFLSAFDCVRRKKVKKVLSPAVSDRRQWTIRFPLYLNLMTVVNKTNCNKLMSTQRHRLRYHKWDKVMLRLLDNKTNITLYLEAIR